MPEPRIKQLHPNSTKQLEGFSEKIRERYSGFAPGEMKERITERGETVGRAVEQGVSAISGELKRSFGDTRRQAKASVKKIRARLKL